MSSKRVLLIHQGVILHYRVKVYNFLSIYLEKFGIKLIILSEGVQEGFESEVLYRNYKDKLGVGSITKLIVDEDISKVITFCNLKELYLLPILTWCRFKSIPSIYWGHGRNLENSSFIKDRLYDLCHVLANRVLLYSERQIPDLLPFLKYKMYVANNTLNLTNLPAFDDPVFIKNTFKDKYNIKEDKILLFCGRVQQRKKLDLLLDNIESIDESLGVVVIGSGQEKYSEIYSHSRVYFLGELYNAEVEAAFVSSDLFCIPGHIGLSLVEALYYSLPVLTLNVKHAPEVCYLKDGVNGYICENTNVLISNINRIIHDPVLLDNMSKNARIIYESEAHISIMAKGFETVLRGN